MSATPQVVTIVIESQLSGIETQYLSTEGYITSSTDTPQSRVFLPRLKDSIEYSIEVGCHLWGNSDSKISFGVIDIENTDGALDSWMNEEWRDRTITIRRGLSNENFSAHEIIAIVVIDKISAPDLYTLRFTLRSKEALLEIPLQKSMYPALTFAPSLEATPKPICIGQCFNIPGLLVDSATLDYDVHDDEFLAIDDVKDQGVSLNPSEEWDISIDSSIHGFRFNEGNNPAGKITADVRGAHVGGNLINRLPEVINYLVERSDGVVPTSDIDTYSVNTIDALAPYNICYYGRDATTISSVLSQVMDSYCGWWYFDRFGMLKVGRLEQPSASTVLEVNDINIIGDISIRFDDANGLSNSIAAVKNWSPNTDSDIAGSLLVDATGLQTAERLKRPYQVISTSVPTIHPSYSFAIGAEPIKTLIADESSAQSEIDRIAGDFLFSNEKYFYTVQVAIEGSLAYELEPGDSVLLKTDRFGLSAGKSLLLLAVKTRLLSSVVELTLWGDGP